MIDSTSLKDLPVHDFFKHVEIQEWDIMAFLTWEGHLKPILLYQKVDLHRQYKSSVRKILDLKLTTPARVLIQKLYNEDLAVCMMYLIILILIDILTNDILTNS